MAVRQYIGARYVTKVYENSLDPSSAEWESGVTYEPLTMVTYLNSSYLSKKEVPGSVGDPAANPTYWVVTGAYNGQILNLQNQIDTINNVDLPAIQGDITNIDTVEIPAIQNNISAAQADIATLKAKIDANSRNYIIICDSYGERYNSESRNYFTQAFYELGITSFYDFSMGSAGFTRTGNLNFLAVLQDNESVIPDKDAITDIIVMGGANDQLSTPDIDAGISAFMAYAKAQYKNATISIGHFTNTLQTPYSGSLHTSILEYKKACAKYGAAYITNSEFCMARLDYHENDAVHPSESGQRALTRYFQQFILAGYFDVKEVVKTAFTALDPSVTITTDAVLFTQLNGMVTVQGSRAASGLVISFSSSKTIATGLQIMADLFKITKGFFYSLIYNCPTVQVTITSGNAICQGYLYATDIVNYGNCKVGLATCTDTAISGTNFNIIIGASAFALYE